MASRQHPQQNSGARIQEQLWEGASRHAKHREVSAFAQTKGRVLCQREKKDFPKVRERRGNVYENKGPALRSPWSSGNVQENKGSYALKTGMLLKLNVVGRWGNSELPSAFPTTRSVFEEPLEHPRHAREHLRLRRLLRAANLKNSIRVLRKATSAPPESRILAPESCSCRDLSASSIMRIRAHVVPPLKRPAQGCRRTLRFFY
jgi:hypothetical protein